ncbi:MAG TPA: alpha-L-fucosidase [Flavisolibacter sp.]|jgi:alpha-L-fucosidase|nr:alpha-L-fucosidase [Flavisolibacter sp.]
MKTKLVTILAFLLISFTSFGQQGKPPAPYGALPSQSQVQWQKLEYYMFIHFGPNTFTDKEWGHGDEDPKVFNPTQLDAGQWARTAKAAGMKGIIITAKHHDGFCLWPSKYSTHTVRESAWKNGKGDVLRELSDACKKYGLKFGVYLSPWDRNHPAYGTPEYNTIFASTLQEVLTGYGPVFEQWFDGANGEGPNGKKQVYDWPLFHQTVYTYQPQAIIFSDVGPGARWVGNESGIAGTTNWSTLDTDGFAPGLSAPPTNVLNEGNEDGKYWVPAEVDVSIRPGWFYSPSTDDKVKSLNHLLNIYYSSVGRNANLLLNVPVDRRGLIHANDSIRLMELKKTLDETFKTNLAKGRKVAASDVRAKQFAAANLTDGNYNTYWTTNDNVTKASFTIDLGKETSVNRIVLQEYIPLGQRVKSFSVDYWDGKMFRELDRQTTIGYKRILTFPAIKTTKVRVTVLEAKACPVLSEVQLYKAPELLSLPQITRSKEGKVSITSESADVVLTYTTDGSEPAFTSLRYTQPLDVARGGTVKARAFIGNGTKGSETVTATFDLAPAKWKIVGAEQNPRLNRVIDANPATFWIAQLNEAAKKEIVIDLGEQITLKGFSYTPRQDGKKEGIIYQYNFYISEDGTNWTSAIERAAFANIGNNPVRQDVRFNRTYKARFIRLEALSTVNENDQQLSVAEIGVLTRE